MRTKKSIYNMIGDIFPQIIISVLGFFRIKVFLSALGTERLGVYQLFGQILSYLALAELGLTSAVMYYLYKPIHDKNYKKVSAIISGARRAFMFIMLIMLLIGTLMSPFVKFFIADTTLSNTFIIIAFILTILVNILSYFSTPYILLFDASQEKYKYIVYNQIILAIRYIIEMIVIYFSKNLFFALIIEVLFTLIQNIVVKYLFYKNYPEISLNEECDYSFLSKTKDLVPHKIGSLVATNIDVIILSKFVGITYVVIYNCYYYITNTFTILINKISSSTLAGIGDLLVSDDKKAYDVFLEYNAMLYFLATIVCVPLFVMLTPFVGLWYGNDMTVGVFTCALFVFILYYGIIRIVLNTFCTAAGIFKETIKCVYIEVAINLSLSLLLVHKFQITGLLVGTSLSLILSEFTIKPFILNRKIFNSSISKYYLDCFMFISLTLASGTLFYYVISFFNISSLFVWMLLGFALFVTNFVFSYIYYKVINRALFFQRIPFLKGRL